MSSHSYRLNNVYIESRSTIAGPLEYNGPLGQYFDSHIDDYYADCKSAEKAEQFLLEEAYQLCMRKTPLKSEDISLVLGSDLLNQNTSIHYTLRYIPVPFIGVYSACSSICSTISLLSLLIEGHIIQRGISLVSSHNLTAERQYRYPIEYGVQRRNTSTFTATGAICVMLSNKKSKIKVESITIGQVIDYKQKDPNDMGRAMAPAAYHTFIKHLEELDRTPEYYDMILTGDLSSYGSSIFKSLLARKGIKLNNYNDCGNMLYNDKEDVDQGGSGIACSALVTFGYICSLLEQGTLKRVLLVATGALLSPIMSAQKESIPSIAHAISLEACL